MMDLRGTLVVSVIASVLILGVLASAPGAAAEPITFEFRGVVTDIEDPNGHVTEIQVGDPYEISISFDSSAIDVNPDPVIGSYNYDSLSVRFGSTLFVGEPPLSNNDVIFVNNNQISNKDAFGFNGFTLTQVSGPTLPLFNVMLLDVIDDHGTVFFDTSLPLTPPDITKFETTLLFFILDDSVTIEGNVESIFEETPEADKICDDETISTGVFRNIKVAIGKSCTITGDTIIEKNLKANGARDVIIDGSPLVIVGGNVEIKNSLGEIIINNANIDGKVTLRNNSGDNILVTSNSIGKNFDMKNNDARDDLPIMDRIIIIDDNVIDGNVKFENNFAEDDFFVRENTINGNLIQKGNEVENNDIALEDNIINGNIDFKDNLASGEIDFIGNEISGNVKVVVNTSGQQIYFNGNNVGGKLLFKDNDLTSGIFLGSNTLKKVTIKNNPSSVIVSANTFDGTLEIKQNADFLSVVVNSFTSGDLIIKNNDLGFSQILLNSGSKKIVIKNNSVLQDFAIVRNTALEKIQIEDNIVGDDVVIADLICRDNTPAPIGSGNVVSGSKTDQCSLL